jgi:MYXO-CTERM domain-containing protein
MALGLTLEQRAYACGGCFTPPTPVETESVITDEKMVLSVSMSQTTLYDQISYSGSPSTFAWVLPIKGTVTVGLSADVMFQVINQFTTTTVEAPPTNCPPPPTCGGGGFAAAAPGEANGATEDKGATVTVTAQQQVGPYETVQLHSNDGSALNDWLTAHGYSIPDDTKPVIAAYVAQHFDFLALKLVPGQGVQSMQPVRVTSHGASPTLPLHMVAVGTGATTGITIWVVADGRWAPSNFPTFTIADSEIAWDWATESSNYEALRLAKEATFQGRGWQIESSLELNQYSIQQTLLENVQYITQGNYSTLPVTPPTNRDAGASSDAGGDAAAGSEGDASSDAGESEQVTLANADLAVLFNGIAGPNVRVTRMRSDVAKAALSVDMILEASADQSELTNLHTPGQQVGEPQCAVYSANGCTQTGTVPRSVAQAQAAAQGGGGTSVGGGCSTTRPSDSTGTTVGILAALAAAVGVRIRQKRRGR